MRLSPPGMAPSPHFSPGGVTMAPDFFLQRVLATEERSRHYARGSMYALKLKGKKTSQGPPSAGCSRMPSIQGQYGTEDDQSFIIYPATR